VIRLHMYGATQIYLAAEGAGAIATLYGSERSFPVVPFHLLRPLAEAAGRGQWLLDLAVSVEERIVRTMNVRLHELAERRKLLPSSSQGDVASDLKTVYAAASDLSRDLTSPTPPYRVRYVAPGPLSSNALVKSGLGRSSAYGEPLSVLASGAIHGSVISVVMSMAAAPERSPTGLTMAIAAKSDQANMLLMAAGLTLIDAREAMFAYWGYHSEEWDDAKERFIANGRDVLRRHGVAPS
jgi:hypothetical protein